MRKVRGIFGSPDAHWVGDGFPVRSMVSPAVQGASSTSPFLLLDYAGPAEFAPAQRPRGVGVHPHRGSRPSPSSIRARSSIATRPAKAA